MVEHQPEPDGAERRAEVETRIDKAIDAAGRALGRGVAHDEVARGPGGAEREADSANSGNDQRRGHGARRDHDQQRARRTTVPWRPRGRDASCARRETRRRRCRARRPSRYAVTADVASTAGRRRPAFNAVAGTSAARWTPSSARRNRRSTAGSPAAGTARGCRAACACARPCARCEVRARAASRATPSDHEADQPHHGERGAPAERRAEREARRSAPARSRGCRRRRASCTRGPAASARRWRSGSRSRQGGKRHCPPPSMRRAETATTPGASHASIVPPTAARCRPAMPAARRSDRQRSPRELRDAAGDIEHADERAEAASQTSNSARSSGNSGGSASWRKCEGRARGDERR